MGASGFKAIVTGSSAGGMKALLQLFSDLPAGFSLPIICVQHVHYSQEGSFVETFDQKCKLKVELAREKEPAVGGHVYFASPDYHLLVEKNYTFSLSVDNRVNYARPSIDVLFESAADTWGPGLIGILLTGANFDGAAGMRKIRNMGGFTIAQDPLEAESPVMPQAAIDAGGVSRILSIEGIKKMLRSKIDKGRKIS